MGPGSHLDLTMYCHLAAILSILPYGKADQDFDAQHIRTFSTLLLLFIGTLVIKPFTEMAMRFACLHQKMHKAGY